MRKTIVVTGTNSGLGEHLFDLVSSTEHSMVAVARRFTAEQSMVAAESGERIRLVLCDLAAFSDSDERAIGAAVESSGNDEVVLINNAGIVEPISSIGQLPAAELRANIEVNYVTPLRIVNALAGNAAIRLRVVNVSSGAATRPVIGWAAYCSSKAAIRMALDVAAQERHIEVVHFDPGVMDTGMQETIRGADSKVFPDLERFRGLQVAGKLKPPRGVAETILNEYVYP